MREKKKKLTRQEEFDIMKMILDKFLWVGVIIILFGVYRIIFNVGSLGYNMLVILMGAVLMLIFNSLIIREFEYVK